MRFLLVALAIVASLCTVQCQQMTPFLGQGEDVNPVAMCLSEYDVQ
jgi:hypothetical protein